MGIPLVLDLDLPDRDQRGLHDHSLPLASGCMLAAGQCRAHGSKDTKDEG